MLESQLQDLCEKGQLELMETRYLDAVQTLIRAERIAWEMRSFDTLSRLYLPLQEARRQIRQRCGEGAVRMHLLAGAPDQSVDVPGLVQESPVGQFLIAGWDTIQPAVELRRLALERHLYLETFLASVQPGTAKVRIVPTEDGCTDENCLMLGPGELPQDSPRGNPQTYAGVMALWERLHLPFLAAAKARPDPISQMQAYRLALRVDPACELAHQFLADIARHLARTP